jgi:hypothetical protein
MLLSRVWWYVPIIPALGRRRQEYCKFKANLSYITKIYIKTLRKAQ